MKERPILFGGEEVRTILTDSKTQTRRVVRLDTLKTHQRRHAGCWQDHDPDLMALCRYTNVRLQRLQEISEGDARAEGVEQDTEPCDHKRASCEEIGCLGPTYRSSFCARWVGGKHASWANNPWVWAFSFERLLLTATIDTPTVGG